MLEIFYKMQPLDYVYLLVGIILFIFAIQSFLDKNINIVLVQAYFGSYIAYPLSLVLISPRKLMAGL